MNSERVVVISNYTNKNRNCKFQNLIYTFKYFVVIKIKKTFKESK